jgi:poly(hydroxyalkanoate) granule-associated protein
MKHDDDPTDDLRQSAQKIWLAGLGALAVAEEEGTKLFNRLVDRGSTYESEAKERAQETGEAAKEGAKTAARTARDAARDVQDAFDRSMERLFQRTGVPSRDEIHRLTEKVEELNAKIAAMEARRSAPEPVVEPIVTPAPVTDLVPTDDDE